MSLYDDVLDKKDIAGDKADVAGWSAGYKLLQGSRKKSSGPTFAQKRPSGKLAPVVDLKRNSGPAPPMNTFMPFGGPPPSSASTTQADGEIRFNHITGKMETTAAMPSYAQYGVETYRDSPFSGMSTEYDPSYPNEYSDFTKRLKEMRAQEKEAERMKEEEERRKKYEAEREKREKQQQSFQPPPSLYNDVPSIGTVTQASEATKRLALYDSDSESDDEGHSDNKRVSDKGATFAPPPVLLEDTGPPPPVATSQQSSGIDTPPPPPLSTDDLGFVIGGKGGSVASKIMQKMGYRQGSGLGREEQGMSMALQVEKTSRRGGKILHEKDIAKEMPPPMAAATPAKADSGTTNADLLRNPSKVLLLMNMVGPGEVDDDLEPETAEECSKYGKVSKCVIYEMPGAIDTEAVRIFVEFDKISFAIKAAIDLNGRYFGGRVVRAAFYSPAKFSSLALADEPL